jgi:hypothetical protein
VVENSCRWVACHRCEGGRQQCGQRRNTVDYRSTISLSLRLHCTETYLQYHMMLAQAPNGKRCGWDRRRRQHCHTLSYSRPSVWMIDGCLAVLVLFVNNVGGVHDCVVPFSCLSNSFKTRESLLRWMPFAPPRFQQNIVSGMTFSYRPPRR